MFLRRLRNNSGQVPLSVAVAVTAAVLAAVIFFSVRSAHQPLIDGRQPIVFWGSTDLGEDIYTVLNQFETENPEYKVIYGSALARDLTGDAQRLLSAIAGGVPPDIVFFDRFAIGEWAARGALEDLTPYMRQQNPSDPYYLELGEFYNWAIEEASYRTPGSDEPMRIYGIPNTADIRFLYLNSNLLRQEGLVDAQGAPRPPANWAELRDYAQRLTRYHSPGNNSTPITQLGFAPNYGNSWLYMYAWQAGGEFLDQSRTRATMDAPPVVRALQFMRDIYDDLGGFGNVDAFQQTFQAGALDPFILGKIAMKIDGDWALARIAEWRPNMDFFIVPAPMPQDQLDAGRAPITWAGGWAYVMPSTAQNKDGAFKLMQFLNSWKVVERLERGKRELRESEGRLYLPRTRANRVQFEKLVEWSIDENPDMPQTFKDSYKIVRELMPQTLIRPVSPVGQLLWVQHVRAYELAVNHALDEQARQAGVDPVQFSLAEMQRDVQRRLDAILEPPPPHKVNWTPYFILYALILAIPFAAMAYVYKTRRRQYGYKAHEVGAALVFASPWFIGFIVLLGGPIVFSILFSFTQYDVLSPARYVGLANYRELLRDPVFYTSLYNTAFMLLRIPLLLVVGLAIALLLNHSIRGMGIYRTTFYLPSIMPLVAASLLWIWLLNPGYGAVNQFLTWAFDTPPFQWMEWLAGKLRGAPVEFTPPLWLQDREWSKPALILMNVWTAGGSMIIWLAGLQSIPGHLYEAASIDGAGVWRRFKHLTPPLISPYTFFNMIIGIIGTMQIFSEAYIMTAGGPADSTLFYAYYLFKQAFQFFRMGYASALAWILFVLVLALTLLQLWLSNKWVHYER